MKSNIHEGDGLKSDENDARNAYDIIFAEPKLNGDEIFKNFDRFSNMYAIDNALVIEEVRDNIKYSMGFCRASSSLGILHRTRRHMIEKVHIIMPSDFQVYHVSGLEKYTHYTIRTSDVPNFQRICKAFDCPSQLYSSHISYHQNEFIVIRNNALKYGPIIKNIYDAAPKAVSNFRERHSNFSLTYGFSGRNRKAGGPPVQTTMINKANDKDGRLVPLLLHVLCELTEERIEVLRLNNFIDVNRLSSFSQSLGSSLGYQLKRQNIFEGVDCSFRILSHDSSCLLEAHCDTMNDWRPNFNYCSVVKAKIFDDVHQCYVNVSIIAYTRKEIGDFMYGPNKYL
jgi:hypothetical protein